jgi:hypothetical protein
MQIARWATFFHSCGAFGLKLENCESNSPIDLRHHTSTFHAFSATSKRAEMQVSRDEITGPPLGPTLRKLRLVDHYTATEKSPGSRRSFIASRNLQSLRSYAANDTWLIVVKDDSQPFVPFQHVPNIMHGVSSLSTIRINRDSCFYIAHSCSEDGSCYQLDLIGRDWPSKLTVA